MNVVGQAYAFLSSLKKKKRHQEVPNSMIHKIHAHLLILVSSWVLSFSAGLLTWTHRLYFLPVLGHSGSK